MLYYPTVHWSVQCWSIVSHQIYFLWFCHSRPGWIFIALNCAVEIYLCALLWSIGSSEIWNSHRLSSTNPYVEHKCSFGWMVVIMMINIRIMTTELHKFKTIRHRILTNSYPLPPSHWILNQAALFSTLHKHSVKIFSFDRSWRWFIYPEKMITSNQVKDEASILE